MIVMLLPASDYDPTESAVPWSALKAAGIDVRFATPDATPAYADVRLVEHGFSLLSPLLMTRRGPLDTYRQMIRDPHFLAPMAYSAVNADDVDGIFIPGGHAAGMRTMLDSEAAQDLVAQAMDAELPVGAVCHGVLLLARATSSSTGRSVLHGRRTTAVTALLELTGWNLTRMWLGRYYRTYAQTVQTEVTAVLANPNDFIAGPWFPRRDSVRNPSAGFTVQDRNYVSARWPGDSHRIAQEFVALVLKHTRTSQATGDSKPQ
ncbi:hypothetical protein BKG83_16210 [Mycobacteroides chelonae]|uniref:Thiamine biosynthesis protein ThiJ n=1 Tax=Mycobacteroides chelonae TaxID=1774 RepID=A0A1S1LWW0_MYCCH|nr:hypothetical protein BKG83_16210 [Mycobacteroides chelonae]OHU75831.1 hypothetical protein BKG84_26370 [Mycobacteroides chelonae]PKQ59391.1 hypothetical protein B5566_03875 [Mycobacterium sp. MHSD3]